MSSTSTKLPARAEKNASDAAPFPPALMGRVGFLLAMTKGGGELICSRALAPLELQTKQFGLLTVLATEGQLSQQRLGEWTRHDRSTMVTLIDALEERGYVRRERNPEDRRAYLLQLTTEGKRVQARGLKLILVAEEEMLASLTKAERRELTRLLGKVAVDIGRPLPVSS